MKKFVLMLYICLLFVFVIIPIEAKDCAVEGSIEDIIKSMNSIADFLAYQNYPTTKHIDINNCHFEILSGENGLYTCKINDNAIMGVFTDKFMNSEAIKVYGITDRDGLPRESVLSWSLAAAVISCGKMKYPDIYDLFVDVLQDGYRKHSGVEMVSRISPNNKLIWEFIVANN